MSEQDIKERGSISPSEADIDSSKLLQLDLELASCGPINLREVTISTLQLALQTKQITSQLLIKSYLGRIAALNPFLNCVIEVNPEAEEIALALDAEREGGKVRGPLHGIPILIKANIGTCDQMETCAGSLALLGLKPKKDAEVVNKLRQAGAVILGKTNMSEFAYYRGSNIPSGWSGRGKQTRNAYQLKADPSGSSSGSSVAVATNLCPVALGTETNGSIVSPASKAAIVGLKPTVGHTSGHCVIPISFTQDSVGPMARTVADAATLYGVIANHPVEQLKFGSLQKLAIGVPRSVYWIKENCTYSNQIPELDKILDNLKRSGITVVDMEMEESALESVSSQDELVVFNHEMKHGINNYLKNDVICPKGEQTICSLADIIKFNEENPCTENYNQDHLKACEATNGITNETYLKLRDRNRSAARELIDKMLKQNEVDCIAVPTDSLGRGLAAVAGYPVISVPAGISEVGVPFGLAFIGTGGSEIMLLEVGAQLEAIINARRTPLFLP